MKRALITGVTGQDGSYLAELLLLKGYEVHGIIRRASSFNTGRIDHIYSDPHNPGVRMFLHFGDLTDGGSLHDIVSSVRPTEVYNLGAQSHVKVSFDHPEYTENVNALGVTRLLEAVRKAAPNARFYQASSSEMFGNAPAPQTRNTPFRPVSPYGVAKLHAHQTVINYRKAYGLFAVNGILFNHESPRRSETFVTRKITKFVADISAFGCGYGRKLYLGNLSAKRDWGFAGDYVEAMWLMLQQKSPVDYMIGSGQQFTVSECAEKAFAMEGFDYRNFVSYDPRYTRPNEVDSLLCGSAQDAEALGWKPRVDFASLLRMMIDSDIIIARREHL